MHAESHMYLLDTKSSPSLIDQNNKRKMSSIKLNLLTKTTWKLKTAGGILVFRVLVQVRESASTSVMDEQRMTATQFRTSLLELWLAWDELSKVIKCSAE